ncbi:type I-F CRISPR-associated endoribonuclease Cas6/Csy4 [Uliginosibacterium sp. sgz301328]|uniref:type I-F CRISPR-associated endoribonuclease Cas6/Csy4 n=1 Tax=Uliginosibacterium sp. sgz301328 TaxID=3243764 RepID=UPI00359EC43D
MDHYIDIRVRPDPEIATAHILNALADRLHLALVGLEARDIGISFPRFRSDRPSLGDTLRLHGTSAALSALMVKGWAVMLADYVEVGAATPVPIGAKHRVVVRRQATSNADRVRRRQMKRQGWSEEEARARIPDSIEKRLDLPYLELRSRSTGQPYRLFIEHRPCQNEAVRGNFNAFGLSASATVPWF